MIQHSSDTTWRHARLRSLTNYGYITIDSPVLDVSLDSWYFLPPGNIGRLPLYQPISPWLGVGMAEDLAGFVTQTVRAFRGFAQLRICALSYRASPSSIQGWSPRLPILAGDDLVQVEQYVVQHALIGQLAIGLSLDFDLKVMCRSQHTGKLGEVWLPGFHVTLQPETPISTAPSDVSAGESSEAGLGVSWIAICSSACASLFRQDNDVELALGRTFWHAAQAAEPTIEVAPGEDYDYQMLITEAHPSATGRTNAELWSVNYPQLQTFIKRWEQAISNTFEWNLSP